MKYYHLVFMFLLIGGTRYQTFGQFTGGDGAGIAFMYLNNASCSVGSNFSYTGGQSGGHAYGQLSNSVCGVSNQNPFTGGFSSGFTFGILSNTACAVSAMNPFIGGNSDGYSLAQLTNTICTVSNLNPYTGGSGVGYSDADLVNNFCLVVGVNPFWGGQGSGFSYSSFINNFCTPSNNSPYTGGIGSGHFASPNASALYWQGDDVAEPTNWNVAANWSLNMVPNNAVNISIPVPASGYFPTISSSAETKCINIYESSFLNIQSGASLTVFQKIYNDGTLILNAEMNNNPAGSFIVEEQILGTGIASIEHFYDVHNQWQYTTVPFSNVTSDFFVRNASNFNVNFYSYYQAFDLVPNPASSLYTNWDLLEDAWVYAHNGNLGAPMNLNKGIGYAYGDEADRLLSFSNTFTDLENNDLNFSVSLNSNDANADYFDGWNLIGNAYTCAIDWDSFSKTNIENTLYYWDGPNERYVYYNGAGGTETGDGSNFVNGGSRYIPSLQAFFVKATATGTFTIPRSARVHSNQTTWKKSTVSQVSSNVSFLKLAARSNNKSDELSIRFMANATPNFDSEFDAHKMYNPNGINFFSLGQDYSLAINSLPNFDTTLMIPLYFIASDAGINTIELSTKELPIACNVFLKDLSNNVITDLSAESYQFVYEQAKLFKAFELYFSMNQAKTNSETLKIYAFEKTLYIRVNALSSEGSVFVYNSTGQLVLQDKLLSANTQIPVTLAKGVYFVKVLVNNEMTYKKVFFD